MKAVIPSGKKHRCKSAIIAVSIPPVLVCVDCGCLFASGTTVTMSCWNVQGALEQLMIHHAN